MGYKNKMLIFFIVVIISVVVLLSVFFFLHSKPITYNSLLVHQLKSLMLSPKNINITYNGTFQTNQPAIITYPKIGITVPFNYSFYRDSSLNDTRFQEYFNMEIYNILYSYFGPFSSGIPNTNVSYNKSNFTNFLSKFKSIRYIAPNIAFSNASGFYLCTTKPYYVNSSKAYNLPFMCGKLSKSDYIGLHFLVYNLSQVMPIGIGYKLSTLNLSVKYLGASSFLGNRCYNYSLSSKVNSSLVSVIYRNSLAYVNGTECLMEQNYLPLHLKINVIIPSQKVYLNISLAATAISNQVNGSYIDSVPNGSEFNLIYGNITSS